MRIKQCVSLSESDRLTQALINTCSCNRPAEGWLHCMWLVEGEEVVCASDLGQNSARPFYDIPGEIIDDLSQGWGHLSDLADLAAWWLGGLYMYLGLSGCRDADYGARTLIWILVLICVLKTLSYWEYCVSVLFICHSFLSGPIINGNQYFAAK